MTVSYEQATSSIPKEITGAVRNQILAQATEKQDFLARRKAGIGGSDVAAILGLSHFRTAVDVYQDKRGEAPEQPQSEAMYWGSTLEEVVAKEFQRRTGMKIQRVNTTLRTGENGWMIANIDRAIVVPEIAGNVRVIPDEKRTGDMMLTTDAILECKTANAYSGSDWGDSQEAEIVSGKVVTEHKIPVYYETQIQWYMGVTGARVCYVAVLLGGSDFRIYKVNRDDDVIRALIDNCGHFWRDNVLGA